ncbi:MAG: hypothetical protein CMH50_06695 [Myxococcales bacterium]|nr:hypothetical protein [Myxococcales bacterium]
MICWRGHQNTGVRLVQSPPAFKSIDAIVTKSRLDEGWNPFVLDVREASEAAISSLDFTDQLQPHTRVHLLAETLPTDRDILVYCRSGGRSAFACEVLNQLGLSRLYNLEGGINGWAQTVDPSLKVY